MEGGAPRRPLIRGLAAARPSKRHRAKPTEEKSRRIFQPSNPASASSLFFWLFAHIDEGDCWQIRKPWSALSTPGKQRISGGWVATSSCRITFICFARQILSRRNRWRIGLRFGKTTSREHGLIVISCRFGNAISGSGNYVAENLTEKNGNTWKTIPCATVM